jgi:hypothetical protein
VVVPVLLEVYMLDCRPHLTLGVVELNVVQEMSMMDGAVVAARCPCSMSLAGLRVGYLQCSQTF